MTLEARVHTAILSYQDIIVREIANKSNCPHFFVVTDFVFLQEAILYTFFREVKSLRYTISLHRSLSEFITHSNAGQSELFTPRTAQVVRDTVASLKADEGDIIIQGDTKKRTKKQERTEELTEAVMRIKQYEKSNPLIYVSMTDAILSVAKSLYPESFIYSFYGQKPWDKTSEAISWIEWYVTSNGYTAERQALQTLYELLDGDFHAIRNEIDKCMIFTYPQKKITTLAVQEICEIKEKANLMKLFDELLSLSRSGILREMSYIDENDSTHPIAILRFIKQQAILYTDIINGRKPLPFKSKTYENRLRLAHKIGVLRLEEWIGACTRYELAFREGLESDTISSRILTFLFQRVL